MMRPISPQKIAAGLSEFWSPAVVGEVDDAYVKVAKIQGEFTWHTHDEEDEMFYVLAGRMWIEMEDTTVELNEGEMFIVPKGVRHRPSADQECQILLIERKSTHHTGGTIVDQTRSIEEQLRQD